MRRLFLLLAAALVTFSAHAAPFDLQSALDSAQPGQTLVVPSGMYRGAFVARRDASADAHITLVADGHAQIVGNVRLEGDNWTLEGFDISDPDDTALGAGVEVFGAGIHVVNNVIHDHCNDNGLGAWSTGSGQVYYGNILYGNGCAPGLIADGSRLAHPHNIYTQNDGQRYGVKTFEHNLVFEPGCSDNCFVFHGYGSSAARLNGYRLNENLFAGGRVLLGGGVPAFDDEWRGNLFYVASVQIGYSRPSVASFTGNTFFGGRLMQAFFWSSDSLKPGPSVVAGNIFITTRLDLDTARFVSGAVERELAPLDGTDIWDGNAYLGPWVNGDLKFAGRCCWSGSLANWQAQTGFDAHSVAGSVPSAPLITTWPNAYDGSVSVVVLNPGADAAVTLDFPGQQATVYSARNRFGAPVAQGRERVAVPLAGGLGAFVVEVQPLPPTATPIPATATPSATLTATPTATSSATPTATATPTNTPTATSTPTATPTSTPTATNAPTETPTLAPSATPTPLPERYVIERFWDGQVTIRRIEAGAP